MTDRPILFSAPMVRAILAGTKTQTRRVVKTQPVGVPYCGQASLTRAMTKPVFYAAWDERAADGSTMCVCPYGVPGDRLWVREAWAPNEGSEAGHLYRADHGTASGFHKVDLKTGVWTHSVSRWRPSIHMPRAVSRITLEIADVRVERLQAISEADAAAEGVHGPEEDVSNNLPNCPQCGGVGLYTAFNAATGGAMPDTDCERCDTPKKRFRLLWESINGAESWDANPWVWIVEFKHA